MKQLRLLRETSSAVLFRAVGAVAGLILSLAITRNMTPQQAGLCFLGITIITVLFNVGVLGMHVTLLKHISSFFGDNEWPKINGLTKVVWVRAGAALFFLSLGLAAASNSLSTLIFEKPLLGPVVLGMSPAVLFMGLGLLLAHQLQAALRIRVSIFMLSIGTPVIAGLAVILLKLDNAQSFAIAYSSAATLTFVVGIFFWNSERIDNRAVSFDSGVLWRSCTPLWVASIMSMLILWSAQLIAGIFVSSADIALLAVAQRLALLVSFILMSVNLVVSPRFAALHNKGDMNGIRSLTYRTVRLMLLVSAPMLLLCWIFPAEILQIFGEKFRDGQNLLRILASAQFVNVLAGPVAYLLMMTGNERDQRNAVIIAGCVAIVASFALIPKFGLTGAAIAAAFPLLAQNLAALIFVKKRLGFTTAAFWRTA